MIGSGGAAGSGAGCAGVSGAGAGGSSSPGAGGSSSPGAGGSVAGVSGELGTGWLGTGVPKGSGPAEPATGATGDAVSGAADELGSVTAGRGLGGHARRRSWVGLLGGLALGCAGAGTSGLRLGHLALDAMPDLAVRLDRLDHQVQLAEPALPQAHLGGKSLIDAEHGLGLGAFGAVERAERVLGGKGIGVAGFAHGPRHCSTSRRLRRNEARNRLTGMSSLIESCSRVKAP